MMLKKMQSVNIIGYIDDVDTILKRIIRNPMFDVLNASRELQQSSIISNNNSPVIKECKSTYNLEEVKNMLEYLAKMFNLEAAGENSSENYGYDFNKDIEKIRELFENIKGKEKEITGLQTELDDIKKLHEYISYIGKTNADFSEFINMKFVRFKIGRLARYNMDKLRKNYENIPAIIFRLHEDRMYSVIMVFYPDAVEIEVNRAISSLGFEEYKSSLEERRTVGEYIEFLQDKKREIEKSINDIREYISSEGKKHRDEILRYCLRLEVEQKVDKLKSHMVCINDFFYITGLIPKSKKDMIEEQLKPYSNKIILHFEEGDRAAV